MLQQVTARALLELADNAGAAVTLIGDPAHQQLLREVMSETGTTQATLSRISGVRQPSISQFLSGKVDLSDEQLDRLRGGVRGCVHTENVERWTNLISEGDVIGLQRALTGLDRRSIEMREVSPFGGLLPDQERLDVLRELMPATD